MTKAAIPLSCGTTFVVANRIRPQCFTFVIPHVPAGPILHLGHPVAAWMGRFQFHNLVSCLMFVRGNVRCCVCSGLSGGSQLPPAAKPKRSWEESNLHNRWISIGSPYPFSHRINCKIPLRGMWYKVGYLENVPLRQGHVGSWHFEQI